MHALISQQNGSKQEDEKKKTETPPNLHVAICVSFKKFLFDQAYYDLKDVVNAQVEN